MVLVRARGDLNSPWHLLEMYMRRILMISSLVDYTMTFLPVTIVAASYAYDTSIPYQSKTAERIP